MEWEGIWASQYPSNDGKDGRVDLIRVDHKRPIRVNTGAGEIDTGATKEDKNCIVATKLTGKRKPMSAPPCLAMGGRFGSVVRVNSS